MTKQMGFTLVELILAITFFSSIMLVAVSGFIQINRTFTRGLIVKRNHDDARGLIKELSSAIRDAKATDVVITPSVGGGFRLCVGQARYGWNMFVSGVLTDDKFDGTGAELIMERVYDNAVCASDIPANSGGVETIQLIHPDLIIQYLDIALVPLSTNSYKITLVASTDARGSTLRADFSDVGINAACEIGKGDQFCDVAKLETVVTARN